MAYIAFIQVCMSKFTYSLRQYHLLENTQSLFEVFLKGTSDQCYLKVKNPYIIACLIYLLFPHEIHEASQQFLGFTFITKSRVESIIDQNVFLSKENRSTGSDIIDNNKTKLKINKGMKVRFGKDLPDKFLPYIHQARDSGNSSLHNTLLME